MCLLRTHICVNFQPSSVNIFEQTNSVILDRKQNKQNLRLYGLDEVSLALVLPEKLKNTEGAQGNALFFPSFPL